MGPETPQQENIFEGVDNDELARRIADIDSALQEYSDGDESNLKRGEMRATLFDELTKRMDGDDAAVADIIEKNRDEDLEQAA